MTSNRGHFEPCLQPLDVSRLVAPRGLGRVLAAQEGHRTDLARLAGAFDIEEDTTLSERSDFIADAARFAASCGSRGVVWEDVEEMVEAGCRLAGVELGGDERLTLYEAWDAACSWPEAAA